MPNVKPNDKKNSKSEAPKPGNTKSAELFRISRLVILWSFVLGHLSFPSFLPLPGSRDGRCRAKQPRPNWKTGGAWFQLCPPRQATPSVLISAAKCAATLLVTAKFDSGPVRDYTRRSVTRFRRPTWSD
jgi:hypothetical protein